MSDEAVSNEQVSAPESQASESTGTSSLFQGTPESPFSAFYTEAGVADTIPDGPFKGFLAKYKDGNAANEGFRNLNKLASSKGFERPAEGAPEEEVSAFNKKLNELRDIPDDPSKYEIVAPEGFTIPDEVQGILKQKALENGFDQKQLNSQIPLFVEITEQFSKITEAQHFESEVGKLSEMFGGVDGLRKAEPELRFFAEERGYDLEGAASKHAEFWKVVNDLKALQARFAQVTGEDVSVKGDASIAGGMDAELNRFMDKGSNEWQALTNAGHPDHRAMRKRFDDLMIRKAGGK